MVCNKLNYLKYNNSTSAYIFILLTILLIHFSLKGKKSPATGPTTKAQIIVPSPTVPPSKKPMPAKHKSTTTRTMLNLNLSLSLITIATRSLGPVPAADLITIVIPNARITQPRMLTIIFTIKGF